MTKTFKQQIARTEGYAVAEFAITLPALLSVFAVCFWCIGLGISKFELESYSNNAARTLARGEALSQEFIDGAPNGMSIDISKENSQIVVLTKLSKTIPLINKEVEINAVAKSVSEVYETLQ